MSIHENDPVARVHVDEKTDPLDAAQRRDAARLICRLLAGGCILAMLVASVALARVAAGDVPARPGSGQVFFTILALCAISCVGLLAAYPRQMDE
jgi:hypothetical protein